MFRHLGPRLPRNAAPLQEGAAAGNEGPAAFRASGEAEMRSLSADSQHAGGDTSRRGPAGANSERLVLPAGPVPLCLVFRS